MKCSKGGLYRSHLKRPLDLTLSIIAITALCPVLLFIALLIRIRLGSPVLFKQKRPGLNEKIFTMYKFRTMTDETDKSGEILPDSARITKFGNFLRSTSLDELPELFNILKGDMSIVGPRPQLVRDMVFMTRKQRTRHNVLPGLTGWAQVCGRNCITWEDKLSLDLQYIDDITFLRDFKIILITIAKVFQREGVSAVGMETAEDFGEYLLRVGLIDKRSFVLGLEKSRELEN